MRVSRGRMLGEDIQKEGRWGLGDLIERFLCMLLWSWGQEASDMG